MNQHGEASLRLASVKLHLGPVSLALSSSQSAGVGASPEAELTVSFDPRELAAVFTAAAQAFTVIGDLAQRLAMTDAYFENVLVDGVNEELRAAIDAGRHSGRQRDRDRRRHRPAAPGRPAENLDVIVQRGLRPKQHDRGYRGSRCAVLIGLGLIFAPEATIPALGAAAATVAAHRTVVVKSSPGNM